MDSECISPIESPTIMPEKTKKKRIRNWTAEDRALHREIEKSRREAFSESLMELTELLPTLKADPRPSKHAIVDASIAYHQTQQARCDRVNQALQFMIFERDKLIREVNHLRDICHHGSYVPRQARPIDPAVLAMLRESNIPAADLTSEHPFSDDVPGSTPQIIGRSLTTVQPDESLLAIAQGSLVDSSTIVHQSELPQPPDDTHTLVDLSKEPNEVNLSQWNWVELNLNTTSRQEVFSPTAMNGTALPWDTTRHIVVATQSHDVESKYTTDPLCVVDDSVQFWTQHSGGMNTTSPSDNVSSASLDLSTMWHPSLLLQGAEGMNTNQLNDRANLFNLDLESLSRPVGDIAGTDPVDLSAGLRLATQ